MIAELGEECAIHRIYYQVRTAVLQVGDGQQTASLATGTAGEPTAAEQPLATGPPAATPSSATAPAKSDYSSRYSISFLAFYYEPFVTVMT